LPRAKAGQKEILRKCSTENGGPQRKILKKLGNSGFFKNDLKKISGKKFKKKLLK